MYFGHCSKSVLSISFFQKKSVCVWGCMYSLPPSLTGWTISHALAVPFSTNNHLTWSILISVKQIINLLPVKDSAICRPIEGQWQAHLVKKDQSVIVVYCGPNGKFAAAKFAIFRKFYFFS